MFVSAHSVVPYLRDTFPTASDAQIDKMAASMLRLVLVMSDLGAVPVLSIEPLHEPEASA